MWGLEWNELPLLGCQAALTPEHRFQKVDTFDIRHLVFSALQEVANDEMQPSLIDSLHANCSHGFVVGKNVKACKQDEECPH